MTVLLRDRLYGDTGLPVQGATVQAYLITGGGTDAGTASTLSASTTTDVNGVWKFTTLADPGAGNWYDVKLINGQQVRWRYGNIQAAISQILLSAVIASPHFTTPVIDSGGLQVTAGNVGIGGAPVSNAGLFEPTAYSINASATVAYGGILQPTLVAQANGDTLYGLWVGPTFNDNAKTGVTHYGVYSGGGLNLFAGNVGIGTATDLGHALWVQGSGLLPLGTNVVGIQSSPTIPATATAGYNGIVSAPITAASAFTLGQSNAFLAVNPSKGAGSAITTAIGYYCDPITAGSTNNYGIYVNPPSGGSGANASILGFGDVLMGGVVNGANNATSTVGFLWIPYCAGAPTGVPANNGLSPFNGHMAMQFDAINSKLWVYTGSSWKGVVLS